MRYVTARLEQELREITYRYYITESIFLNGENKRLTFRYRDLLDGKVKPPDHRSGDEIAEDVIKRAGLKLKE